MKIIRNTLPISDIYNMMKSGELTVNRSYQRGTGLWPDNARSYFIDTILNDFPFPKVVIRQIVDLKTKKAKREIIDGQQRLTTIRDFIDNKFKLTNVSKKYVGMKYEDLPESIPEAFLSYEVSTDNIVTASTEEILEIFRRLNSYTLPLNTSEKRHATYQGQFKWFISNLTEHVTPFFEKYQTLTLRDISRMGDADLLTECCQLKLEGIQNRSSKKLEDIYKNYDIIFANETELKDIITTSFNFIKDNFSEVFENCKIQSYNFYSLMGALIYNRYGFPDPKQELAGLNIINQFCVNVNQSSDELIRIFTEAEDKLVNGNYPDFVNASIATTHSYKNRLTRIATLINALRIP
ncbi:DUF262 domain-containing protein [Flavobacterium sp. A45]|uniref:DUF262 domain-containing protein n=1 Tax=Flavobacterium sp. A45 TaxID=1945862 RepID=UPI000987C8B6|nr:DUF262 domain-containing protein [Flavobacterium sp. A45]OOG77544.1 hypothetical protein B0E44_02395 [Flavobacterium sp. A45]